MRPFMKREYVSFDVFDTCLIRRCGLPYKIWDLMADRLFGKDDSRGRLSFTGNRGYVEELLSKTSSFPNLDDIYTQLNVSQWGFNKDAVMNLEMEIEEQELFPNPDMLNIVNDYREKGFTISFISDMYLPTEFLKRILIKFGFCRTNECVFVSADCKASKYDGKLFDYVLKETKTKANQWIHYGDDERSDYRVPKSKGIKAVLVTNTRFTEEENRWIDDARFYSHKHEIELWSGLCRLTRLQNDKSFAATMAVDFVASVYVPYVIWVLRTAKAKGIKTLYFLARDGHIFLEIANNMIKESDGIECRYLKVSRQSIYKCAFYNGDNYELENTIGFIRNQNVEKTLQYIGIDYDSLSACTKKNYKKNYVLNNKKRISQFIECLEHYDADVIKQQSEKYRLLLVQYLNQEKVFEPAAAFVDLGWAGSSRCMLNYIIRQEGFGSIPSFYWGCTNDLIYGNKDDELYVFQKQYDMSKKYSYCFMFFEHYASMTNAGSTIGYYNNGEHVVAIEDKVESNENFVELNEKMVSSFAKKIQNQSAVSLNSIRDIFLCCGLRNLDQMLRKPSLQVIDFFSNLKIENLRKTIFLIRRLSLKNTIALLLWGVPATELWLEASLIKTFGCTAPYFVRIYKRISKTTLAKKIQLWREQRT